MGGLSRSPDRIGSPTGEKALGGCEGEERVGIVVVGGGVVRDSRGLPMVLATLSSVVGVGARVGHVLEGDGAFDILAGEDCLVLPFHKDLDVGWHGGAVSAWGPAAFGGRRSRRGQWPATIHRQDRWRFKGWSAFASHHNAQDMVRANAVGRKAMCLLPRWIEGSSIAWRRLHSLSCTSDPKRNCAE